ncbi:MAG: hypothetical protein JWR88_983 [Pseudonocardia sp.]|nr:hypothetical protein [Pseudonocardia sp.]
MALSFDGVHGAYLRSELVAQAGLRAVQTALRNGGVRPLWPGVLIDANRQLDRQTRAAAALLTLGTHAAINGSTAAYLHGCTAIDDRRIHARVPYGRNPRPRSGLVVHHADPFQDDVVELDQLRVLALDRVISDLLCTARPADALAVTDQALAMVADDRRETFRSQVQERLARKPDPRGTVRGGRLLGLATGRAESPPESWLLLAIVDLGFPPPTSNWCVRSSDGRILYRVDLAWPELRIALEYDGYAAHFDREDLDAARADDLQRRGWIVVRATADDLRCIDRLDTELRLAFQLRGQTI